VLLSSIDGIALQAPSAERTYVWLPPAPAKKAANVANQHLSTHSFDPKALSSLFAAFDRAWKRVELDTDANDRNAVRNRVALAILGLAAAGETDVERLTAHAVARARFRLTLVPPSPRGRPAVLKCAGETEMPHRIDDARHWRARAEEARELAAQLTNPESKRIMLGIAVSFAALAQLAVAREAAKRSR
jgi:hypothetical protein